jgi:hypothetical protein
MLGVFNQIYRPIHLWLKSEKMAGTLHEGLCALIICLFNEEELCSL